MREITVDNLIQQIESKGYVLFKGDYNLNLIGIRAKDNTANTFNDLICVLYQLSNKWILKAYKATTDPGIYYREHPSNVDGTAILFPTQHRAAFTLGKHKGEYPCLVQCKPVKVYRDKDKDQVLDYVNPTDTFSGIQIHRANSKKESTVVNNWSAGCQVFASPNDFADFMALYFTSKGLYGNKITYTLLEEW